MEITMQDINLEQEEVHWVTTVTAEGEAVLTDDMPSASHYLLCQARVSGIRAEKTGTGLTITGTAAFTVLYDSEEGLASQQARCGFTHTIPVEPEEEAERYACQVASVQTSMTPVDDRHVNLQAEIELQIVGYTMQNIPCVAALDDEGCFTQSEAIRTVDAAEAISGSVTIREDVELPAGLPSIARVLTSDADILIDEVGWAEGQILVKGNAHVWITYASTTPAIAIQRVEFTLPMEAMVAPEAYTEEMLLYATATPADVQVRCFEDASGALRVLALQIPVNVEITGYGQRQATLLEDAYSIYNDLRLGLESVVLQARPYLFSAQTVVSGTGELPDLESPPARIVETWVYPILDAVEIGENQMTLQGRLQTWLLYVPLGGDRLEPLQLEAPFTSTIPVENLTPEDRVRVILYSTQATAMISMQDGIHVRAQLEIRGIAFPTIEREVVTQAEEGEPYAKTSMAPIMLVIPQAEDTPWTLAKRCRIPVDQLMACNDSLQAGKPIGDECMIIMR